MIQEAINDLCSKSQSGEPSLVLFNFLFLLSAAICFLWRYFFFPLDPFLKGLLKGRGRNREQRNEAPDSRTYPHCVCVYSS